MGLSWDFWITFSSKSFKELNELSFRLIRVRINSNAASDSSATLDERFEIRSTYVHSFCSPWAAMAALSDEGILVLLFDKSKLKLIQSLKKPVLCASLLICLDNRCPIPGLANV